MSEIYREGRYLQVYYKGQVEALEEAGNIRNVEENRVARKGKTSQLLLF